MLNKIGLWDKIAWTVIGLLVLAIIAAQLHIKGVI